MDTLPFSQRPHETPDGDPEHGLWEFPSEVAESRRDWSRGLRWLARALVCAALGLFAIWAYRTHLIQPPAEGLLTVRSDPRGAAVEIDGRLRGLTPFTASLPAGDYQVVVVEGGRSEAIAATITPGVEAVHHVRLPDAPREIPPPPTTGRLRVLSEPPGALVTLDDVDYGVAPVTIADLEPGQHQLQVANGQRTYTRDILIEAGTTETIVVTGPPELPSTGWLNAQAGAPLDIFEDGHHIGTTDERILLPAGTHDLVLAAEDLGFRTTRRVTIGAGTTSTLALQLPQSTININAEPWADVWIDGAPVGQTPIANLAQPIGLHQLEFRHPELGTKTLRVLVTLKEPSRVAMDMR